MLTKDIQKGVLPAPAKAGTMNVNNQALGTIEAWAFNYVTEGNEAYGKQAIEAIQNYMETLVLIDPNNDNYTARTAGMRFSHLQKFMTGVIRF